MRRIQLLRPGEFADARGTKVSLSESHIRDIAAGYDPARHEAPLVVGSLLRRRLGCLFHAKLPAVPRLSCHRLQA